MTDKTGYIIKMTHVLTGHFIIGATVNFNIYKRDMLKRLVNGKFKNPKFQSFFSGIENVLFEIVATTPSTGIQHHLQDAFDAYGKMDLFCNHRGRYAYHNSPATYLLTTPSGYFYIGSAINLNQRLRAHRSALKLGGHYCKKFSDAFTTWDELSVKFTSYNTRQEALVAEQLLLDKHFGTFFCCNDSSLADGSNSHAGKTRGSTHRDNLSKALLGKPKLSRKGIVSIDGVTYRGLQEASKAVGIGSHSLHKRLVGENNRYVNWFYVDRNEGT